MATGDFYVFGDLNPQVDEGGEDFIEIGETAYDEAITRENEKDWQAVSLARFAEKEGRPLGVYKLTLVRKFGEEEDVD